MVRVFSLFTTEVSSCRVSAENALFGIRSLVRFGRSLNPPSPSSALPRRRKSRRATYIAFAENQLSPSLIGLSPLATSHPLLFQQKWVRPSSKCYLTFSLLMARSLGFGSDPSNSNRPIQTRFRCAYALTA